MLIHLLPEMARHPPAVALQCSCRCCIRVKALSHASTSGPSWGMQLEAVESAFSLPAVRTPRDSSGPAWAARKETTECRPIGAGAQGCNSHTAQAWLNTNAGVGQKPQVVSLQLEPSAACPAWGRGWACMEPLIGLCIYARPCI